MSRKEGQKRKLLVLLEILARETDEKHPLSVPQLVEKLQLLQVPVAVFEGDLLPCRDGGVQRIDGVQDFLVGALDTPADQYLTVQLLLPRVDKMQNVHQLPDTTREGAGEYANFDVNTYMQQMFGMFNGPLKRVTLQCENRFAGAMIDRFGTAPILTPCADGEHFTMTAEIQVSPQFFGWVAGFGTGVVVSGPPEVRAEMKKTLDQLQELYR